MFKFFQYIKSNWWRFTPDSWPDWYCHWKAEIKHKYAIWKLWGVLPWHNNSRCSICAGYEPQAEEFCYHYGGKGYIPRWNETWLSKLFKCIGLRINNKIKKNP